VAGIPGSRTVLVAVSAIVILLAEAGTVAAGNAPTTAPFAHGRHTRVLVGEVFSILDGDTIRVRLGSRTETVRYIGIDTPELEHPTRGRNPDGRRAAAINRALVGDKTVRLELDVQERDQYGRLLAYVYVGDRMVNAELVRRGYARVVTIPPNLKYRDLLLKLQREARSSVDLRTAAAEGSRLRPGRAPSESWTCPVTHPIKGNFTTRSGAHCIFHVGGGKFYGETKPERCYATEEEAARDGCRRSNR
jgi:micrococcal nuclease